MNAPRHSAILVVAILSLIGGGFGMCCNLGGIAWPLLEPVIDHVIDDEPDPDASPGFSLGKTRIEVAQWFLAAADLALAVCLIVVGVGLLKMRRWARTLGLILAVLLILAGAAGLGLNIYQVMTDNELEFGPVWTFAARGFGVIVSVADGFIWLGLGLTLLIVLLWPSIGRAFGRGRS